MTDIHVHVSADYSCFINHFNNNTYIIIQISSDIALNCPNTIGNLVSKLNFVLFCFCFETIIKNHTHVPLYSSSTTITIHFPDQLVNISERLGVNRLHYGSRSSSFGPHNPTKILKLFYLVLLIY